MFKKCGKTHFGGICLDLSRKFSKKRQSGKKKAQNKFFAYLLMTANILMMSNSVVFNVLLCIFSQSNTKNRDSARIWCALICLHYVYQSCSHLLPSIYLMSLRFTQRNNVKTMKQCDYGICEHNSNIHIIRTNECAPELYQIRAITTSYVVSD